MQRPRKPIPNLMAPNTCRYPTPLKTGLSQTDSTSILPWWSDPELWNSLKSETYLTDESDTPERDLMRDREEVDGSTNSARIAIAGKEIRKRVRFYSGGNRETDLSFESWVEGKASLDNSSTISSSQYFKGDGIPILSEIGFHKEGSGEEAFEALDLAKSHVPNWSFLNSLVDEYPDRFCFG